MQLWNTLSKIKLGSPLRQQAPASPSALALDSAMRGLSAPSVATASKDDGDHGEEPPTEGSTSPDSSSSNNKPSKQKQSFRLFCIGTQSRLFGGKCDRCRLRGRPALEQEHEGTTE